MIILKEFPDKHFDNSDESLKYLIQNKKLIATKKSLALKKCDGIGFNMPILDSKDVVIKSDYQSINDINTIKIVAVGNSCNYYDSHGDVSIPGSWNRTVKNTKEGLHLQEHSLTFEKTIAEGKDVYYKVENRKWRDLGVDANGETDCIVMYSTAHKIDNPYMFDKYLSGKVKQHSAGLRYVQMELAVNNSADWAKDEKEVWDKYYDGIVNKEDVDQTGYFWAVIEQKIIEISAVPRGSNPATSTISVESADSTSTKIIEDSAEATPKSEQVKNTNLNLF